MAHFDRLAQISPKIYIAFEKIFQMENLSKRRRLRDLGETSVPFSLELYIFLHAVCVTFPWTFMGQALQDYS